MFSRYFSLFSQEVDIFNMFDGTFDKISFLLGLSLCFVINLFKSFLGIVLQCYIVDLYTYNLGLGKVFNLDHVINNSYNSSNNKQVRFFFISFSLIFSYILYYILYSSNFFAYEIKFL